MKITCTNEEKELLERAIIRSHMCIVPGEDCHDINATCKECRDIVITWEIIQEGGK